MPNNNQWLTEILRQPMMKSTTGKDGDYKTNMIDIEFTYQWQEKAILQKISELETEARIDEHYKMIEMITAKDMQTQYVEYWSAGNIRLAKLKEIEALHQASLNKNGDSDANI